MFRKYVRITTSGCPISYDLFYIKGLHNGIAGLLENWRLNCSKVHFNLCFESPTGVLSPVCEWQHEVRWLGFLSESNPCLLHVGKKEKGKWFQNTCLVFSNCSLIFVLGKFQFLLLCMAIDEFEKKVNSLPVN